MEDNKQIRDENEQQENINNETTPANDNNREQDHPHKRNTGNAASINAIITSATDNVRARRHTGDWSNTGTNISYEGATAPGGGGSVGTGQASGQSATGSRIHVDSEYDNARLGHTHKKQEDEKTDKAQDDGTESEERDII